MLNSYIQHIKSALASYQWIESVEFRRFDISQTDIERILLYRIRLGLADGNFLEACERLSENIDTNVIERTKYHFHWQDQQGRLIKRWDNAPHHPELKTFPDHVHVGPDDICIQGASMSLLDVLDHIDQLYCTDMDGKQG